MCKHVCDLLVVEEDQWVAQTKGLATRHILSHQVWWIE